MDWGSFAWGVIATLICGGIVATLIAMGGSEGWWD